jgi:ElaB/YqjD/DUF883 family membrane-anchored ribosome-binding protein
MNRFAAAPLTLILVVLGLVACGGGGDDAPSKADFAADANEICKDAEEALQDVGRNASSPDEIADAVDKVIDETQKSVDRLKDLDRPDGAAGEAADKFVDALQSDIEDKGIPALEDLRDALKDNDQQAAQKAARRLQAIETTDSDRLAREAGVKGCAS